MTTWTFDESVASRFQHEAIAHIPDYTRVIDMCLEYANKYDKTSTIIDVGSALGYTMHSFIQSGYVNVYGVDSSKNMIDKSLYPEKTFHSHLFPDLKCDLVLMNWTLHFIKDKKSYLSEVYKNLNMNGSLILTDKTVQSDCVKNMYYNFKRNNGVSDDYIYEKENLLTDYMHTETFDWYTSSLRDVGFSKVEVINARYGFVTFLVNR